MNLKLIFNPAAGRGRAQRQIEAVESLLRRRGANVETYATRDAADLTRVAAESSRAAYDRVVVCGGDGSVHFAVREFDTTRAVLGVVPLGSGDDFARVLGIPRDVEGACDAILAGTIREVDVATANGIRYVGVAGLGFDSEVAAFANRVKLIRGSAVYLYAILRVLPRFTPHVVRIRTNGKRRTETVMFAVVGNSRQYGGGIKIVPDAQIDDGLLDYCIVHRTTRFQLLKTLPLAYTGAHVKRPYVETGRSREVDFDSDSSLDVYADGERVTQTPVTFAVEAKLKVAVPRPRSMTTGIDDGAPSR
ncbi:MAG TPA: diacylglycerol kinase family protein [Thermoanaerobaculia bacterium]